MRTGIATATSFLSTWNIPYVDSIREAASLNDQVCEFFFMRAIWKKNMLHLIIGEFSPYLSKHPQWQLVHWDVPTLRVAFHPLLILHFLNFYHTKYITCPIFLSCSFIAVSQCNFSSLKCQQFFYISLYNFQRKHKDFIKSS